MGKLEEMSDGNFILDTIVDEVHITKVFKESNTPLDNVSKEPKSDGFYLNIPDIKSKE